MLTMKLALLVSTIAFCARHEGADAPWKLVWSGEFEGAKQHGASNAGGVFLAGSLVCRPANQNQTHSSAAMPVTAINFRLRIWWGESIRTLFRGHPFLNPPPCQIEAQS